MTEFLARTIPWWCVGLIVGVSLWYINNRVSGLWAGILLIIVVILTTVIAYRLQRNFVRWCFVGCIGGVLIGIYVAGNYEQSRIFPIPTDSVNFQGTVVALPDERPTKTYLTIYPYGFPDNFRVRVAVPWYQSVKYGDLVSVSGSVSIPRPFETDTGAVFDYPRYLAVSDIVAEIRTAQVSVITPAPITFYGTLYDVRNRMRAVIAHVLPEPWSGLARGMVLGDRSGISSKLNDTFRKTGLSHIIVLSGFNVTIVVIGVSILLRRFGRQIRLWGTGVVVVLFVILSGADAPVVRAGGMTLLVVFADILYRTSATWRVLLYVATGMILLNPRILLDDVGFQLSIAATAGLVFLANPIQERLRWITNQYGLREIVASTIAATIATLPILLIRMHSVAGLGLLANIVVLPVVSVVTVSVFVMGVVGLVSPVFAWPLVLVVLLATAYIYTVGNWFGAITPMGLWVNVFLLLSTFGLLVILSYFLNPKVKDYTQ